MERKKLLTIFTVLLVLALVTACGTGGGADKKTKLYIYNWGEYMSRESETVDFYGTDYELTDVIRDFELAYPEYQVEYRTFDDNEMMYAQLATVTYDLIVPSDYMVDRLMREEKLQALDFTSLPNVTKYLDNSLKQIEWTDNAAGTENLFKYAVPYLYCTVGLMYNQDLVARPASNDPEDVWAPLFDPANKNRVGMYSSMRESIGMALNYLGYSLNSLAADELEEALDLLIRQRQQVAPILGIDELKDKFVSGELACGIAWSGDHVVVQQRLNEAGLEPDKIQYILPRGSNISVDMMAIPADAKNVQGAHDFINFMYETEIAVKNAVYVGYSSPHLGAVEKLPAAVTKNKSYYPDLDLIKTLEPYFSSLEIDKSYDDLWLRYLVN